jgi:PTS system cellobiose-specific IIC component
VIPYALIGILCWVIRTILDFDVATWVTTILMPILSGADNIGMYTLSQALTAILWAVGLHGDNIVGAVTGTFLPAWDLQNVEFLVSGGAISAAPHVWTQGLSRLSMWTCSAWPLLILMMKDSKKLPQFKALAAVAFPPAIFSIVEPIIFGLPIMLNPYLIIPFVVSHTLSAILTYAATAAGIVGKLCVSLPWATPAPLLGFAGGGGSIGGLVWPFLMCAMGLVIFWPFWNAYVEDELKKAEAAEADAA